jgi:hypothetical protein
MQARDPLLFIDIDAAFAEFGEALDAFARLTVDDNIAYVVLPYRGAVLENEGYSVVRVDIDMEMITPWSVSTSRQGAEPNSQLYAHDDYLGLMHFGTAEDLTSYNGCIECCAGRCDCEIHNRDLKLLTANYGQSVDSVENLGLNSVGDFVAPAVNSPRAVALAHPYVTLGAESYGAGAESLGARTEYIPNCQEQEDVVYAIAINDTHFFVPTAPRVSIERLLTLPFGRIAKVNAVMLEANIAAIVHNNDGSLWIASKDDAAGVWVRAVALPSTGAYDKFTLRGYTSAPLSAATSIGAGALVAALIEAPVDATSYAASPGSIAVFSIGCDAHIPQLQP